MLMPKRNRIAIYELLFKEGAMVAKKDVHMPKHPELADKNVPHLHVMKAMQSLKSRGYVKEQFAWRHFYWYLTNEGIHYLRDYLHLPPRSCLLTCATVVLRLAGHGPKVWRESDLQDSQEGKATESPTDEALCPLVPTRKPRPGLGQQLNSSLEADLVVDVRGQPPQ
uniref:Small ribosomal subunit protein eS10 n=1 Tax=Phocoena sinus TaxID=42100 RepID=A0A8C9E1T4_PHOSS